MSTVTYSLQFYTPDTNVDHVQEVKVQIVGEEFIRTEEKTVIDRTNRPQTETQGYVNYQTLERCLLSRFQIPRRSWKYGAQQSIFGNFQGVWNVTIFRYMYKIVARFSDNIPSLIQPSVFNWNRV